MTATAPAIAEHIPADLAVPCGFQEDGEGGGFMLWNLMRAIPGHPAGSTVVQATVEKAMALETVAS